MSNRRFYAAGCAIAIAAICGLYVAYQPTAASGYATSFEYAVSAKWTNNLNFMVCLSGVQEREYKDLFLQAVEEWKQEWDHFGYRTSNGSGCHINVHIVKSHSDLLEHGQAGYTHLEYWERGAITKATIILPTHMKAVTTGADDDDGKAKSVEYLEPISKTLFYRAALHEFGHALNLGHFDDNGEEPIDIMHPYPADDDQEQGISQRNIEALNWLYLGFFEKEIYVRTDKKTYEVGDTVKISGKVNPVKRGEVVTLEVVDSNKQPYSTDKLSVSQSGMFNYKLKIPREVEGGSFKIKASYYNMIADAAFNINNAEDAKKVEEIEFGEVGSGDDAKNKIDQTRETTESPAIPEIEQNVTILETSVVDNSGFPVSSINSQEQVFIRSSLSSIVGEDLEATYIIQIKNSHGYTVEISSTTYNIIDGSSVFARSWVPPEPDRYEVEVFLWKGTSPPDPLITAPVKLEIAVE